MPTRNAQWYDKLLHVCIRLSNVRRTTCVSYAPATTATVAEMGEVINSRILLRKNPSCHGQPGWHVGPRRKSKPKRTPEASCTAKANATFVVCCNIAFVVSGMTSNPRSCLGVLPCRPRLSESMDVVIPGVHELLDSFQTLLVFHNLN